MYGRVFVSTLLLSSFLLSVSGQQPPRPSPPTPQDKTRAEDQDVVRITTNLVQVDAVVTKDGKQVTDLKPEDFELFEDGKPQTITNFSYVSNVPVAAPAKIIAKPSTRDKNGPPVVPAAIHQHDVRRTVALVVDDLGLSFESMARLRNQIRKFLDGLGPNDLAAIIRTGGDVGALQQFTNDRRLLQSALDHLRWNPCSRSGLYVFQPAGSIGDSTSLCAQTVAGGTLKSLRFILRGLSFLPGRKSMVIFSDYLPIQNQEPYSLELYNNGTLSNSNAGARTDTNNPIPDSGTNYYALFERVAELAIRSSVVIYAVDTRGLQFTGLTAADMITYPALGIPTRPDQDPVLKLIRQRSDALLRGREGSDLIARQTGGFLIRDSNSFGLQRVMDDQQGYYLIGFRPNEETFNRNFHRIKVKLKRKGLIVRTRAGFYGYTDQEARPPELTVSDQLNKALMSPFGANEITVDLTSFFVDEASRGSLVRSFLYLTPRDLTFTEEAGGWHVASFDLRGVLFGDNGKVITEQNRTGTLRFRGDAYDRALRDGVVYGLDLGANRSGAFQFRVAVSDRGSSHIGAAGQFVEVPDLRNGRLALSGIVVREAASLNEGSAPAGATPQPSSNNEGEAVTGGPAVRRFHQRATLIFAYAIYNAGVNNPAPPTLSSQTRIFREGKPIFNGDPTPLNLEGQPDQKRLSIASRLKLGAELPPGEYVLQVIVTDSTPNRKPRVASQWIDFEVVK